jgi:hypothetical protein
MIFFTWLRDQIRQAVLAGVADAAAELGEPSADTSAALANLRNRVLALPAPADAEPGAEPEPDAPNGRARRTR